MMSMKVMCMKINTTFAEAEIPLLTYPNVLKAAWVATVTLHVPFVAEIGLVCVL